MYPTIISNNFTFTLTSITDGGEQFNFDVYDIAEDLTSEFPYIAESDVAEEFFRADEGDRVTILKTMIESLFE